MNNVHEKAVAANALQKSSSRIRWIAKVAILSAVATLLLFLEFPVPLFPAFLKLDFSDIPALLAAFAVGPWAGVVVELVKNLLLLSNSQTMMIGELANFLIGSSLVGIAGAVYQQKRSKKGAILSLLLGTLTMTLVGSLFNYFINIPFYISAMGFSMEAIVGMSNQAGNTLVHDLPSLILWVFVPFNILKGLMVSLLVSFMYKPLSPVLHR